MFDRWRSLGLDQQLRQAVCRGVVLGGGSAGAIFAFDSGHSDSADPTTYKAISLCSGADTASVFTRDWQYIRVPALGLLPG